jgi:hypothetical protein
LVSRQSAALRGFFHYILAGEFVMGPRGFADGARPSAAAMFGHAKLSAWGGCSSFRL